MRLSGIRIPNTDLPSLQFTQHLRRKSSHHNLVTLREHRLFLGAEGYVHLDVHLVLAHHPSSQGWAFGVLLFMHVCVGVRQASFFIASMLDTFPIHILVKCYALLASGSVHAKLEACINITVCTKCGTDIEKSLVEFTRRSGLLANTCGFSYVRVSMVMLL